MGCVQALMRSLAGTQQLLCASVLNGNQCLKTNKQSWDFEASSSGPLAPSSAILRACFYFEVLHFALPHLMVDQA
eukprot:746609-Pyramimonas_sp.AAC.1